MKKFGILLILPTLFLFQGCIFTKSKKVDASVTSSEMNSVHSYSLKTIDGKSDLNLADYKGKKILIVNTASKCGYTPQYKDLQTIADQYKDKLVVIGCPCNQFGGQEPGTASEIQGFCEKNFGVSFSLTEKLDVKGGNQHPLYQWLTSKSSNGAMDSEVTWNFCKYLLDEEGKLIAFFPSNVKPDSDKITSLL